VPFILKWPSSVKTKVKKGSELKYCVELRDVLPTMMQVAGINQQQAMNGLSMLDLVKDKQAKWRDFIDLEHATTYNQHNYWCALTDGKMKYVWFFRTGEEQLFDLVKDKGEERNCINSEVFQDSTTKWRNLMIEHLKERGEPYVKAGKLNTFKKTILVSPNYPQDSK